MEHSIAFVGAKRPARHQAPPGNQDQWLGRGPNWRRLRESIVAALRFGRRFEPAAALPHHLQADLGLMATSDKHWTDIDAGAALCRRSEWSC